ncbi:MAG: DUF1592 domain-containing protein [Lentisphaerales bacterium]|nr:DUF1592 domain-containing protein [Lentisphaerales bacterium]
MRVFLIVFLVFSSNGYTANFLELTKKHCYECHNPNKEKGDVDLTLFKSSKDFYRYYDLLKDYYAQVKSGDMPPEEDSNMTDAERKTLVDYLGSVIHKLESTDSNITGSTRIRRLTGYEYDNSVKHVTGLDLKLSKDFPQSGGGSEGFQNDSTTSNISPLAFEKYLTAAETISTHSNFDLEKGFIFSQRDSQPETKIEAETRVKKNIDRLFAKLYPKDYSLEKYLPRLMKAVNDYNLAGCSAAKLRELSKKTGLNEFILKRGIAYFSATAGKTIMERDALRPWFLLRSSKYDPEKAREHSRSFIKAWKECMDKIKDLEGVKQKNYLVFKKNIENIFNFTEKEVISLVDAATVKKYQQQKMTLDFFENGLSSKYKTDIARMAMPHIRKLMIKAFRMPPSKKEVLIMTKDFMNTTQLLGMAVAARIFVIRTFVSMNFIYRQEKKTGKPTKVNDYELANRLSYFLWASPPDEELMKLAGENKLSSPEELEKQVKRMLKDRQSSGLAKHFAAHWLNFNEILEHEGTDTDKFPEFNKDLAKDMWLESAINFEYIVKHDRSILEIIDADYTFVNWRLRELYGMERGESTRFAKVMLKDKRRGGITSQASILTLTSTALRSSPILRGNWINQSLLGTPTPPAPANVPPLPEEEVVSKDLTLKEQLSSHRQRPECKGCHQRIDPLGFPLENYDAIGRWLDKYEKAAIDSTGELTNGKKIDGPIGLKKYLLREKENYLKHASRKLLAYALGRSIEYYDFYVINEMVKNLKQNDYRFSAMVTANVKSYQFQHKNYESFMLKLNPRTLLRGMGECLLGFPGWKLWGKAVLPIKMSVLVLFNFQMELQKTSVLQKEKVKT